MHPTVVARPALALAALLAYQSIVRPASAEERSQDSALAHELFDQGRALMDRGDYERACAKFEESRRLDEGSGGGTLLNLALCEEKRGRTGSAWALFRKARSMAVRDRREDRQAFADEHIAALTPRLSRLRVTVPEAARLPNLVVLRNGVALGGSEWGEALVVDPGTQVVEAKAPGHISSREVVTVGGDSAAMEVSVPVLKPSPSTPERHSIPSRARAPTVAEILVGGAGVTAMANGGAFGVRAISRERNAATLCPDYDHCNPQGIELSADAARDGRVSIVTFVGGAAMLAGAVVSYAFFGRTNVRSRTTGVSLSAMSVSF